MENKERIGNEIRPDEQREPMLRDLHQDVELPKEVEHWMEKIEKPAAVVKDDRGQTVLSPSGQTAAKIKVNTSKSRFTAGFKKKVDDVGLWLSTFVFRLIKKNEGKLVEFEEE